MSREARSKARAAMLKRLEKRKGCMPRLKSDCGKARCAVRNVFVKSYSITSGKYAPTTRDQYCRKGKST